MVSLVVAAVILRHVQFASGWAKGEVEGIPHSCCRSVSAARRGGVEEERSSRREGKRTDKTFIWRGGRDQDWLLGLKPARIQRSCIGIAHKFSAICRYMLNKVI